MALFGERELDPMQEWIRMESETPAGHVPDTQFRERSGISSRLRRRLLWLHVVEVLALDMLSAYGGI